MASRDLGLGQDVKGIAADRVGGASPVIPLALMGIGAWLVWFGVHYWESEVTWPSDPLKALLTGKPLPSSAPVNWQALTTPVAPAAQNVAQIAIGATIATAAQKYVGAGYNWGGIADTPGDWDCSSFVSYVLGHDVNLKLPGGGRYGDPGYPPHAHGPGSAAYMLFGTGVNLADVRPGDLIVSTEHIGIAISATQMVSAQQPSTGTAISGFPAGFPAGPPVYRRVTGG